MANLTKLNTNENPYGPSEKVLAAIRLATTDALRLYPDPNAEALKAAIARLHGLSANQVFVGNGSDEVLAHVFMALLKHDQPLYFPDITYSFYPVYCGLYGIEFREVPLTPDFQIAAEDYLPKSTERAGAIIFPNPNAPTGCALTGGEVERIVAQNPHAVVVIDEAYVDFGAESAIPLVARYPNLLVVHTLSKSRSLAGLRVGFAVGNATLIEGLERVKNSFNSYPLDRLAIAGAVAAIEDVAWFNQTRQAVIASREKLVSGLLALGFDVLPSRANFIFVRHPERDALKLAAGLREAGIIVRHFNSARISQFLRITVGTDEQCALLISRLEALLME